MTKTAYNRRGQENYFDERKLLRKYWNFPDYKFYHNNSLPLMPDTASLHQARNEDWKGY